MPIKPLAYTLSKSPGLPSPIKRSHCYELIAAAFSYSSYAAMTSAGTNLIVNVETPPILNVDMVRHRAEQLGIDRELLLPALHSAFRETTIDVFTLESLVKSLEFDVPYDKDGITRSLLQLSENANPLAYYGLGLIYANSMQNPPSDYWHKQRMIGAELSDVEIGFADEFLYHHEAKDLSKKYLTRAHELGVAEAGWKLEELFGTVLTNQSSWPISERELAQSASTGDTEALQELALSIGDKKPVLTAALIEFGRLLGADITVTVASAIDEDGNPYDDDVGGPMYADFIEGVPVPTLSTFDLEQAINLGTLWFMQFRDNGVADLQTI